MSRHWAGSKPFNYLRNRFGIEKPKAAQWGEWDDWKTKTKNEHPIGWWLTEELPKHLEWFPETFVDPFHNISYYIRNRWHRQAHVLRTGFKPGTYHDFRERLLHGCMESLVDFVEVEKAWIAHIWTDDTIKLDRRGRSAIAGLKYLEWEMTLDDPALSETERSTVQAESARELYAIYMWWKKIRPARPDPMDASGYTAYFDEMRKAGKDSMSFLDERIPRDPEEIERSQTLSKRCAEIEMEQDEEDNQMLIRLIKIRLSLWT